MGLFSTGLGGRLIDSVSDAISDSSSNFDNPFVLTTVPILNSGGLEKGNIIDTIKKMDIVFSDVETEGQKRGYERAAKEYDAAFERVEKEYFETKQILDKQIADKDMESSKLILKLQQLEDEKTRLERQIKDKTRQVSSKFNISASSISQSLASGTLLMGGTGIGIFDLVYAYKSKKMREAEEKGYAEAGRLYRTKILELKDNFSLLKNKRDKEIQELIVLISDVIKEISDAEMKIAELKIALECG